MTRVESSTGRHVARGTLKFLAAQTLALVAGFVIAAFLTRQLGPELYGLYSVAATIVVWVELSSTSMFSQTTVKFLAEAADWRSVASTLVQAQLGVGLAFTVLLVVGAPTLASWLRSPELATYLRLFALDIPLIALAHVHRSTLIGREAFGRGALVLAAFWVARMVLVLLLVGLGLSLTGAILANIGASLVQLTLARVFVRPTVLIRSAFPLRRLVAYALPLFFYTAGMRLFRQLDLLVVKALGGEAAAAGFYGAAQNLTVVPLGMLAASLSPLLLATLTRLGRDGQGEAVRTMAGQAMRLVACLLPFAGLVAGSAPEIVGLVYGNSFLDASPLVALLIFAALAMNLISFCSSALTAAGRPGWTFALTGPLVPLALGAHLVLVPRFGPVGAASATTALAWLGASAAMLVVRRHCGAAPSRATILRSMVTTAIAYLLSSAWHTWGAWVLLELSGISIVILSCLFVLGELSERDLAFGRSLLTFGGGPWP